MVQGVSFVHRFWPAYRLILGCTIPFAVIGAAFDWGIAAHPWKTTFLVLFTAALAAILTYACTQMKVTVNPEGLHCYDIGGSFHFTRWEEMDSVRPSRLFPGLPYLCIKLKDGRSTIWLPMFLQDLPRLVGLVSTHSGSEHVLSIALAKYLR